MKKIWMIALLFTTVNSYAQVNKADIDLQLYLFSPAKYEYVYLGNVREYYNDGSFKMVQKNYYANMLTIETKEHALHIRFYKDATKTLLTDIMIIPYTMIIRTEAFDNGFIIDLVQ